ncbi:hypothetical protein Nos7524_0528 [Nostoc sp. PCC 7524]|uniref:hypothetical protein n=1 Tax=Nostoc sp. (strain ATCC 29411 / PCC 7524) TaxID=28072 RepID=UPI00029F3EDD|nr:hypothetical protein [Nostoc sp. PCC 7524]AFY46439.1 hypothetical protein Nos7524_0528 [Nostoc sp. PCC 7524]
MAKTITPDSPAIDVKALLNEILPVQAETVLGGATIVDLTNIQDGINTISNSLSMLSVSGNKLFTIDFSRTTINLVIVLPQSEPTVLSWLL